MRYDIDLPKSVNPYKKPIKVMVMSASSRRLIHGISPFVTSYVKMLTPRLFFVILGNTSLN